MEEKTEYMTKEEEIAYFNRLKLARKAEGLKKNYELYGIGDEASLADYEAQIKDGEEALKELPNWYGQLVSSIVSNYYSHGATFDDLMQEGLKVMYEAVKSFDPDKSRFSTYLTSLVRSRIATVVETEGILQESGYIRKCRRKYENALEALKEQGITEPTDEQILKESGLTEARLKTLRDMQKSGHADGVLSLDYARENEEDDGQLINIVASDTDVAAEVLDNVSRELLEKVLDEKLTFEEEIVIRDRYGMNREKKVISREDIARKLNCSVLEVRGYERRAFKQLRTASELKGLI